MDRMMYGEDQTWPMLSNLLRGYCTSLSESLSLCGIPLPIPSSHSDSDELSILYDGSPSPEFNSMSSRTGEQAWFTSQPEVQVQVQAQMSAQLQPRKIVMPLLDLDEEDEVSSSGEQYGESEAERRSRVLAEFQAEIDIGLNPPSPSPSLSEASSSNPFLTPPSPSSPLNHTSPSSLPNHSSSAWQTPELNELKRLCADEGCGAEIAKERISEDDYERIAKGMNNSYWWQMEIPMVRKPREYTGENVVGGVEAFRD
jgi:hypothetical protein